MLSIQKWIFYVLYTALLLSCATNTGERAQTSIDEHQPNEESPQIPVGRTDKIIDERGSLTYMARLYEAGEARGTYPQVEGIILMRDPSDMASLGGPYYDDGLGNLIRRGDFYAAQHGGRAEYAVTFLQHGGVQIALDFRRDRVVDAVLDITPEGRLGVLANPALESLADCIVRRITAGVSPLLAIDNCLGSTGVSDGLTGGAGLGGNSGQYYDRLAAPDCGGPEGGVREEVAQSGLGWRETSHFRSTSESGNTVTTTRYYSRENDEAGLAPDVQIEIYSRNSANDDYAMNVVTVDYSAEGTRVTHSRNSRTTLSNGNIRYTRYTTVNGRRTSESQYEINPATGECTGDCPSSDSESPSETPSSEEETSGDEDGSSTAPANSGSTGSTGQPGPECELEGSCPYKDPRCEAPRNDAESLWDCVAKTGASPLQCLARIQDAVFAGAGCRPAPGIAGGQILQCLRSPSRIMSECLESGGTVAACMEKSMSGAGGDVVFGGENDDVLARFRNAGSSDIDYIETTEFGAILFAYCNEGIEQACRRNPGTF